MTLPRLNIAMASEASLMPMPSRPGRVGHQHHEGDEKADPKKHGADGAAGGEELHDRHAARALFVEDEGRARRNGRRREHLPQQRRYALGRRCARDQKADRLRQREDEDDADEQRQHAADPKDGMPAIGRNDPGGQEPADKTAERKARPEQRHDHRAQPARAIFRREADETRHGAAEPEAGEKAEREQMAQRGADGENAKTSSRGDQYRLAPDPIRQHAESESAQGEASQGGAEHRAQPGQRNVQIGRNAGRRKPDGLQIEAIEQGDEGT
jgi:hypothetical protein